MDGLAAKTRRLPLLVAVLALVFGACLPAESASAARGATHAVVGVAHEAESAPAVAHPRTPGQPHVVDLAGTFTLHESQPKLVVPAAVRTPPHAQVASAASIRGPPA